MKIAFSDFWWKFDDNNNFFIDSMRNIVENVEVVSLQDADLVFFSCFGNSHKSFNREKTKKIYFTGENTRPPLEDCDYALTFDYENYGGKNFRLPLWMLQIDWWGTGGFKYTNPKFIIPHDSLRADLFGHERRNDFCCTIFNRDHTGLRIATLKELSNHKSVACYGEPWNNWFYGEDEKIKTLSNFNFTMCYENSAYPGYYTEKMIHARVAGCVPIYWSDKQYVTDFNQAGILNLCDFENIESLVEKVVEIDNSEILRRSIISQPIFTKDPDIEPYLKFITQAI